MSARSRAQRLAKEQIRSRATRRSPLGGRAARADASQAGVAERNRRAAPHLTSLDDGRRGHGGARAVVVLGPNYGAQGYWRRRAVVLDALLIRLALQSVKQSSQFLVAKTAGPQLKVPSHRLAKAKELMRHGRLGAAPRAATSSFSQNRDGRFANGVARLEVLHVRARTRPGKRRREDPP